MVTERGQPASSEATVENVAQTVKESAAMKKKRKRERRFQKK